MMKSGFVAAALFGLATIAPQTAGAEITVSSGPPYTVTVTNNDNSPFTPFFELRDDWFPPGFTGGLFDSLLLPKSSPANLQETCSCSLLIPVADYVFNFAGSSAASIEATLMPRNGWTAQLNVTLTKVSNEVYTWTLGGLVLLNGSVGATYTIIGELPQRSVAVPGPIAGAGLPLLLGFAGYAARRRRAVRAAI